MWPFNAPRWPFDTKNTSPNDLDDRLFLHTARTSKVWVLWPKRCYVSRRRIWLATAYRADWTIIAFGKESVWTRWYSGPEYTILKLKGY